MNKACFADELVMCPWPSGPSFFPSTIPGTSMGRRFRPIKSASIAMFIHNLIKPEVL